MRIEVPELRRCCFCIPLRYGLLAWAYFRLVILILYLLLIVFVSAMVMMAPWYITCLFVLGVLVCVTDIGFMIVFLIGAHKKNYKLIRIYYYFAIVNIGISAFLFVISLCLQVYQYYMISDLPIEYQQRLVRRMVETALMFVIQITLEGYLIVLIRSEFLKLKRNCKFQFINNEAAAESECRLNINNEINAKGIQIA